MHIQGNLKQLGEDKHAVPMEKRKMYPSDTKSNKSWLQSKYGQDIQPYEFRVPIDSTDKDFAGIIDIKYRYFLVNDSNGQKDFEKVRDRVIKLQKPESYKGLVSKEGQINTTKVWVINGEIDKVEGNFIKETFKINTISDTGISIGQYPGSLSDFEQLRMKGITVIINLMTDEELAQKDIKLEQNQSQCNQMNLKYVRMPMKD